MILLDVLLDILVNVLDIADLGSLFVADLANCHEYTLHGVDHVHQIHL
jgi:hypothetical protein